MMVWNMTLESAWITEGFLALFLHSSCSAWSVLHFDWLFCQPLWFSLKCLDLNSYMCVVFFLAVNVMITWFVLKLQYSSKILKHLCDLPLPQCWFGYYSRLSAPKYAWLNIGKGEGHNLVITKVSGVNVRNLGKIQDKWLLFQRLLASIVFKWKRGNKDRFRSRWIFWDCWWKIRGFFLCT